VFVDDARVFDDADQLVRVVFYRLAPELEEREGFLLAVRTVVCEQRFDGLRQEVSEDEQQSG